MVNNLDVIDALKNKKLSSYVTDFPTPELIDRSVQNGDVILLPHLGASTKEAEINCSIMAAEQTKDFLENGLIINSVNFPNDISDTLEAFYRNNTTTTAPQDIALTQISRSTYNATPNKLTQGTPSQYYVERKINPSIFLYATPSSSVSSTSTPSGYQFCFYYLSKIENPGAYTNVSDVVNRFYPCMMSGLAYYLSMKFSPERTLDLERIYESEMLRALDADNQGTSTFISPQTFYGDGVMS